MINIDKVVNKLKKDYKVEDVDYAIVVGSGLIDAAPVLENVIKVEYEKIGMPKSKVKGHSGSFIFGSYNGKRVVLVSRIHYYECADVKLVKVPFEIIARLGVNTVILLTSCGGLNPEYKVGDVMMIEDHINFTGINPLIGIDNIEFTDMASAYDIDLKNKIKSFVKKHKLDIKQGVFCQMSGPSYETMAEVNMLRVLGADAVSMSTAMDCIISRYLKMRVLGFSVIVNVFNNNMGELTHEEVLQNAKTACDKLRKILSYIIN